MAKPWCIEHPLQALCTEGSCLTFCSNCNAMQEREAILERIADGLEERESEILKENRQDVSDAALKINDHLMKRLTMDSLKIKQLADGIRSIARQREPIRKVMPGRAGT